MGSRGIDQILVVGCMTVVLGASPAQAGDGNEATEAAGGAGGAGVLPPPALSMGQPVRYPFTWGPIAGYDFRRKEQTARVFADVTKRRFLGPLDLMLEGAAGVSGRSFDPALGLYAGPLWVLAGAEYGTLDEKLMFGLILQFAWRRGGLFGQGDRLRFDYRPAAKEVSFGFTLNSPFRKYRMTRPRNRFMKLPAGKVELHEPLGSAELQAQVAEVVHAVEWMDRLLTPRFRAGEEFSRSAREYLDHIRQPGHSFDEEDSTYHHGLEAAFTLALNGDSALARDLAMQAEATIYKEVLLSFDREFGREKKPNHAGGLCRTAVEVFARYLEDHPALERRKQEGEVALRIFRRVLQAIDAVSRRARDRWKDSFLIFNSRASLAWLPLNYGLRHHQYDTQAEWDRILADLTGREFEDCNYIEYLMTEQFHLQAKTAIREAREYEVTIVHDFRGRSPDGGVDIFGWDMVVDGYIAAFVDAINQINQGRRSILPQFFLFLDENYYIANKSREIITYLENLYDPDLPKLREKSVQEQVESAHATLRAAIETSPYLSGMTDEQLRRAFTVHVNITNPFDPAISLDVSRRDHRKIAFRDISEDDPGAGEAIFTGQGIGAHYNGSGWEDRSLLVRGPALVQLKDETRRLFMSQGYSEQEVPSCLQARPMPPDYEEKCRRLREEKGWTTPVSITMNETGYGYKKSSVFKTAMYNLAPGSSFVLTFDSLWISDFWASMFITAALRGVHMIPISPSPRNAPSNASPTLYYLRENMEMLLRAQMLFGKEIEKNHGLLRVGIYAHAVPIDDLERRMVTFVKGREAYPFLKEEFSFHPVVERLLAERVKEYEPKSVVKLRLRYRPLLHLKTQFFGTRKAFEVFGLPQWAPILGAHLGIRQRQLRGEPNPGITPALLETSFPGGKTLQEEFEHDGDAIFTFTIGSQNQNNRSMLLDGEVLVAISGFHTLISAIDFMFILGIASWPESLEEFEQLFPPVKPSFPMNIFLGLIKYQL